MLTWGRTLVFETAMNEEHKVELTDGTVISMKPLTRIEIPRNYNHRSRKVVMRFGEAFFKVIHNGEKPFSVELGKVTVHDIGTSFTISTHAQWIDLAVSSGIASIRDSATGETRTIKAGSAVTFDILKKSFTRVRHVEENTFPSSLVFKGSPLSDVASELGKTFSKNIIVPGSLAGMKFTGQLSGLSFNEAMDVICRSLDLEYTINGDTYVMKKAMKEQH